MALSVGTLPVPMIEPAFQTGLVPAIGSAMLPPSACATARLTAITLPAVAMRTQKERRTALASRANPLSQNHFATIRHASQQAELDKDSGFVAP